MLSCLHAYTKCLFMAPQSIKIYRRILRHNHRRYLDETRPSNCHNWGNRKPAAVAVADVVSFVSNPPHVDKVPYWTETSPRLLLRGRCDTKLDAAAAPPPHLRATAAAELRSVRYNSSADDWDRTHAVADADAEEEAVDVAAVAAAY